jgi:Mitochondrial carrier protein
MYDWRDTFAGVFGSLACVYVGQPFDTVKTRLQTRPEAYRGVVDCFVVTTRREGVLSLWKGATPAVVSAVTENAVVR